MSMGMPAEKLIAYEAVAKAYEVPTGDLYRQAEESIMGNNGSFNYGPIGKDNYMTRNNARDNIINMDSSSKLADNYNSPKKQSTDILSIIYTPMKKVA